MGSDTQSDTQSDTGPPATTRCPCGTGLPFDGCCGPLLAEERHAVTAEQLMRSRYTAFAVLDVDHLARTWHPDTRPRRIRADDRTEWRGLEVVATSRGGMLDDEGTVEFVAHHRRGGADGAVHEVSRFARVGGRWVYVGPADG